MPEEREDESASPSVHASTLADTLVKATSLAVRDAFAVQFAALVPQLARALAQERLTAPFAPEPSQTHSDDLRLAQEVEESHSHKTGTSGSLADRDVRSLETVVANSILEQHGLVPDAAGAAPPPHLAPICGRLVRRIRRPTRVRDGNGTPAAWAPPKASTAACDYELGPAPEAASGERQLVAGRTRSQMLQDRVQQLTGDIVATGPDESRAQERGAPGWLWLFCSCGLVPWSPVLRPVASMCYRIGLLVVTFAILSAVLVQAALARDGFRFLARSCQEHALGCCSQIGLLSNLPLTLAIAVMLALSSALPQSTDVNGTLSMLAAYMHEQDMPWWSSRATSDIWVTVWIWCLTVLVAVIGLLLDSDFSVPGLHACVDLAIVVLIVSFSAAWTASMLYICRTLASLVDRFCNDLAGAPEVGQAMQKWNVLQAVLLKASSSIECSFIAMLVMLAFAFPLFLVDFLSLGAHWRAFLPLLPGLLTVSLVVRTFFVAAAITDKCVRVPALVNSLCFGSHTEQRRQLLVEYIRQSDAGFYVCDVRLTTGMALRFMYMWSIIAGGLAMNVFSSVGS